MKNGAAERVILAVGLLLSGLTVSAGAATNALPAATAAEGGAAVAPDPAGPAGQALSGTVTNIDVQAILAAADRARGNREGVVWTVSLVAREGGGKVTENTFAVQARGFDVLAETIKPAKSKGNKMLMSQGNMWFHKPDLSKPAPISQRQKLSGNAANGDLAATNYAEDYAATRMPDQVVSNELCWVFDLRARSPRCTYDRVHYWVSQSRGVGVRGEYFSVSGKLLKKAEMRYDNQIIGSDGKPQPFISQIEFTSATVSEERTDMTFSEPKLVDLPPSTFDVNRLKR